MSDLKLARRIARGDDTTADVGALAERLNITVEYRELGRQILTMLTPRRHGRPRRLAWIHVESDEGWRRLAVAHVCAHALRSPKPRACCRGDCDLPEPETA